MLDSKGLRITFGEYPIEPAGVLCCKCFTNSGKLAFNSIMEEAVTSLVKAIELDTIQHGMINEHGV